MRIVPWLSQPVKLHSSRNPGACSLTPEQCAFQRSYWLFWYQADRRYALPTVAFFMVAIMLFALGHWIRVAMPRSLRQSRPWALLVAMLRVLAYKKWWVMQGSTQSIGALLLATAGVVYFLSMTLGVRPYYWPNTETVHYGNSPPLATHAGYLALACTPFIYTLATKANLVSLVTAISHEKLIDWHMWTAWAMFVLALVHTFPFIVYHIKAGDIVMQFMDGGIWVTGVVAILAQAWLTFASIPWLRNRYYEFFKSTHRFAALIFIVFFFFHCDFRLSSWDYFIVTAVLYGLSWSYSKCKSYFEYGFRHKARLQRETEETLKITIETSRVKWTAGQHIYLRFVTGSFFHMLSSHPFTVCSFQAGSNDDTLVFYIRARGGITKFLMAQAIEQPGIEVPVLMDGPYGGVPDRQFDSSDQYMVIAGGSGAGFTLGLVERFVRDYDITEGKRMKVIVATREPGMQLWYIEALHEILHRYPRGDVVAGLTIEIRETGRDDRPENVDAEKAVNSSTAPRHEENDSIIKAFNVTFAEGRPNLPAAVRQFVDYEETQSTGLIVCGPASMSHDVGEAAFCAQQEIIKGGSCAKEVWFHAESFAS